MSGPKTPASPNSSTPSVTVRAATTPDSNPSVKVTTAATSASVVQAPPPAAADIQLAVVVEGDNMEIEVASGGEGLDLVAEENPDEAIEPLEKINKIKPLEKYQNEGGGIGHKIGEFLLNLIKLWQNRPLYKENGVIENENIKIEENNKKIQEKNNKIFKNLKGKTEEEKLANLSEEQQEIYQENKKTANENEQITEGNDAARGATIKEQQEAIAKTKKPGLFSSTGRIITNIATSDATKNLLHSAPVKKFFAKLKGLPRPSPPAPGAAQSPASNAATTSRSNHGGSPLANAEEEFTNLQGSADHPTDPSKQTINYMQAEAARRAAPYMLTDPTMPKDSLAQTNRTPGSPRQS